MLCTSAGFFCYGEYYFHDTGKALFFGQTMTVLTLAEINQGDTEQAKIPAAPLKQLH